MPTIRLNVIDPKINGVILYDGPSKIDGKRIIAIATGLKDKTDNKKTGNMIQTWILVADEHPIDANRNGNDYSICGTCKHRHFRSCYVNLARSPKHIWEAWQRGSYAEYVPSMNVLFAERQVRLGAYGDPAAVPFEVWDGILAKASGWTGYTHRWAKADARFKSICMASCETVEEGERAKFKGWRPFLSREVGTPVPAGYFVCPASKEAGKRLTCAECNACRGGKYSGQGSPTIEVHGPSWKMAYFNRGMKKFRAKKAYARQFTEKAA